jgi:DNA-binding GntR family transcriptional regulator
MPEAPGCVDRGPVGTEGVRRVPLREAFRMLAGEGLIAIEPQHGAVMREQSDTERRDRFEAVAARIAPGTGARVNGVDGFAARRQSAADC